MFGSNVSEVTSLAMAVTEELLFFCINDVKFKTGHLMMSYLDGTKKKEIWGKASVRMLKMGKWNLHIEFHVVMVFGILNRIPIVIIYRSQFPSDCAVRQFGIG